MLSVVLEFSMFPSDVGESKSEYVSKVIKHIKNSGLKYQMSPMSTVIEVDKIKTALNLVEECYEILEQQGCNRVYAVLKFDIRKNCEDRLTGKIKSIEDKIGKVNT